VGSFPNRLLALLSVPVREWVHLLAVGGVRFDKVRNHMNQTGRLQTFQAFQNVYPFFSVAL
jgi:hypothetical protein